MKKILLLFGLFVANFSFGQEIISQELYEGTVSNDLKVSFYLKIEEDGCPRTVVSAIYKYQNNKQDNWILLETTFSEQKQQYTFVEHYNTGLMLLKRIDNQLKGIWISPDGKKQLPVHLKKVKTTKTEIEKLEDALEKEHYKAYDC
ncbi:hypothetical protein MG290_06215 [Flavobacterium sp. CBA20B-1]|uniref:hypothetical protein n=1 Tax=unclassified Flavobacterium TaxID=196869 RepID=UPI0022242616|nr:MULTISPECIES: hypothetical protein [unclassified Flavobacterium]WCM43250.1 hypothetical protein MG290_06215 [Flavobacterium sp. CBA20B-1]